MAHIRQIDDASATGPLRAVYDAAKARFAGRIANIIKVMSLDGDVARASMGFYVALMKSDNALCPRRREMLAAVTSNINDCFYWTLSHAWDFGRESGNSKTAEQLVWDWRNADLPEDDRALCAFAEKLTRTPGAMTAGDVEALRGHAFTDEQVHVAVQVIGYFNYINRIADGLGVDDEPEMVPARPRWPGRNT